VRSRRAITVRRTKTAGVSVGQLAGSLNLRVKAAHFSMRMSRGGQTRMVPLTMKTDVRLENTACRS
jgi:hypothetical protein